MATPKGLQLLGSRAKEGKEKTVRLHFLRDVAGTRFFAQTGDVLDVPEDTARGFVRSGSAKPTTEAIRQGQPDLGPDGQRRSSPQQQFRDFAEARAEMMPRGSL